MSNRLRSGSGRLTDGPPRQFPRRRRMPLTSVQGPAYSPPIPPAVPRARAAV
jgi:hypothetical protein